jgi:hypothetical protein
LDLVYFRQRIAEPSMNAEFLVAGLAEKLGFGIVYFY